MSSSLEQNVSSVVATQSAAEFDPKAHMAQLQTHIQHQLRTFLDTKRQTLHDVAPETVWLHDILADFVLRGGKRLRPALTVSAYQLCGGLEGIELADEAPMGVPSGVWQVASASELSHAFFLIHDDIIDRSDTRRGAPTAHIDIMRELMKRHQPDADHLGMSHAILLGDVACACAYEMIARAPIDLTIGRRVLQHHTQMLLDTELGEAIDVMLGGDVDPATGLRARSSEEDVRKIMQYKTAKYTFTTPLTIGLELAGKDPAKASPLWTHAMNVGVAFQIADDILGMFGDEAQLGKSTLSDLQEGKQTLLTVYAFENGSATQVRTLEQHLGNASATRDDLREVQELFRATGALERATQEAQTLVQEGVQALDQFVEELQDAGRVVDEDAYQLMRWLAYYVIERTV